MVKTMNATFKNLRALMLGAVMGAIPLGLSHAATVTIEVRDSSNALIPGSYIYLINFGNFGPSPTISTMAVSATGSTAFTVQDNTDYGVFASSHGYGPSLRNQMFSPNQLHIFGTGSLGTKTVVLGQSLSNRGIIQATVVNATNNSMLFGNVRKRDNGQDVGFGACMTDGTGGCNMFFHNIASAAYVNNNVVYEAGVFDSQANGGDGAGAGSDLRMNLETNQTATLSSNIDIANGLPPDFSANDAQEHHDPNISGDADVEGVVTSTISASDFVPHGHIELWVWDNNSSQHRSSFWTHVDDRGRFKFHGLTSGVTYYVVASGGCQFNSPFNCFDGWRNTNLGGSSQAAPESNDFVFNGERFSKRVELDISAPGTTNLEVYVKDQNGNDVPGGWVNLWGDWTNWHTDTGDQPICGGGFHASDISSAAFANVNTQAPTGYILLQGLRPGNYELRVHTPFTQEGSSFNGGLDGQFPHPQGGGSNHRGCFAGSQDDLRLTVEGGGAVNIYDTTGTVVSANVSSVTVTVRTETGGGRVYGTLTFPPNTTLNETITIMLRGQCGENGCNGGGFAVINSLTNDQATYEIFVPSFTVSNNQSMPGFYWPEVISTYWGAVFQGGENFQIIFQGTTSVRRDFTFAPAGRVRGKLFKPDGSIFRPGNQGEGGWIGAGMEARGISVESWGHAEVQQDGSFELGGLLPGEYELLPQIHGSGSTYSPPEPAPRVTVSANQDSYRDVRFVNGEVFLVSMSTANLPVLPDMDVDERGERFINEVWQAIRLKAGTPLSADVLPTILDGHFNDNNVFQIVPQGGYCSNPGWGGGWCPNRVPSNSVYDVYMMRKGEFPEDDDPNVTVRPYFVILASSKNIVVDQAHRSGQLITVPGSPGHPFNNVDPVRLEMNPGTVTQGVTVRGSVVAQNFLREDDFNKLGGVFDNFLRYIPTVQLFNSNGVLKAVGMIVPSNADIETHGDDIEDAVVNGNWELFRSSLLGLAFGYEIRGVPPGQTYTMVFTTPNYPPYITTVQLGVDGSTSTVNFNWDSSVGQGAKIEGVVQSTAASNAGISNASVVIESRGYRTKTITTSSTGYYKVEGLPTGLYRLTAMADGYELLQREQEVSAATTYPVNFTLRLAPGVITGTVRELAMTAQGPIRRPVSGALVMAYNDTFNGNNPDEPLALYKVQTSSAGVYRLSGLIPNEDYRITVQATGRYIASTTTTAIDGVLAGVDFVLNQKPLQVDLRVCRRGSNIEIIILNPNKFEDGSVSYSTSPVGSYDPAVATEISDSFRELPDGSLLGLIPVSGLTDGVNYTLHIDAIPSDGSPVVTVELVFNTQIDCIVQDNIDDQITGNPTEGDDGVPQNEVRIDQDGTDNAAIVIPPGAMMAVNDEDIPEMGFNGQDAEVAGISASDITLVGNTYNLTITSVNFTNRSIEISLGYDPALVGANIDQLKIYVYDSTSGEYTALTGPVTIDPVAKTVTMSVNLNNLTGFNISSSGQVNSMRAQFDGARHHVNPRAMASGSGQFVVALTASGVSSGGTYKQYNFPNPFNLQTKTVTLRSGSSGVATSIRGTYMVVAPTGTGATTVKIRIYNAAGDMVREITETGTAGQYNYVHWDGRNTAGKDVASGVYFAVVDAPGSDKKNHIKLVLVK